MREKTNGERKNNTIHYRPKNAKWRSLSAQNVDTNLARGTGKSAEEDLLKQQTTRPQNKVKIKNQDGGP